MCGYILILKKNKNIKLLKKRRALSTSELAALDVFRTLSAFEVAQLWEEADSSNLFLEWVQLLEQVQFSFCLSNKGDMKVILKAQLR